MSKEKICGIYCIENLKNGKRYIGLSGDIFGRFKTHKRMLNGGYHINEHLQSAWDKYGEDSFNFYIVEICNKDELKLKEIYYIEKFNSNNKIYGYNKTSGGDGIRDLSEECAEKISISETKKPVVCLSVDGDFIFEYRNCRAAADYVGGRTENIRACCDKRFGYRTQYGFIWMYKEDYDKNGFNKSDYEKLGHSKSVDVYDLYGNYVGTFESAKMVEKELGIPYKNVSQLCNGKRRQSHGYVCRFQFEPFNKFSVVRKDGKINALR